jgi:hypothetical protein
MPKTLPQFRNLTELKNAPRFPVILYCSGRRWSQLRRGRKAGRLQRRRAALRVEPAPWGGGDVILFPVIPDIYELGAGAACTWRLRRRIDARGRTGFAFELDCVNLPGTPEVPGGGGAAPDCEHIVTVTGIDLGCRPVQTGCRNGSCSMVFVPDRHGIGGFFQCQCIR